MTTPYFYGMIGSKEIKYSVACELKWKPVGTVLTCRQSPNPNPCVKFNSRRYYKSVGISITCVDDLR